MADRVWPYAFEYQNNEEFLYGFVRRVLLSFFELWVWHATIRVSRRRRSFSFRSASVSRCVRGCTYQYVPTYERVWSFYGIIIVRDQRRIFQSNSSRPANRKTGPTGPTEHEKEPLWFFHFFAFSVERENSSPAIFRLTSPTKLSQTLRSLGFTIWFWRNVSIHGWAAGHYPSVECKRLQSESTKWLWQEGFCSIMGTISDWYLKFVQSLGI